MGDDDPATAPGHASALVAARRTGVALGRRATMAGTMRLAVVHHPDAGDTSVDVHQLRRSLADARHVVDLRQFGDGGWDEDLGSNADLVVAAGGDGTVAAVFRAHRRAAVPITIIALGTANNIARTLGIPTQNPLAWVSAWGRVTARPFDVPSATHPGDLEPSFVEGVSGGFFARLLAAAERSDVDEDVGDDSVWGRFARVCNTAPVEDWGVVVDGADLSGQYLGLQIMNIKETASHVEIAPEADPGDGHLDVVLIEPEQRAVLAAYAAARMDDQPASQLSLRRVPASKVELVVPPESPVAVDDQLVALNEGAPIHVVASSRQLTVLAPR